MIAARSISSNVWQRFAQEVVANAAVLDDATASTLVQAFSAVPRDIFLPAATHSRICEDVSFSLGSGSQTSGSQSSAGRISLRPSLFARMLSLIGFRPGMRILELGAGSGYGSAVMASGQATVYAVESLAILAQKTRKILDSNRFQGILLKSGRVALGYEEHAPFDAILIHPGILTEVSSALLGQLKSPGGRAVAIMKDPAPPNSQLPQRLMLWESRENQKVVQFPLEYVVL